MNGTALCSPKCCHAGGAWRAARPDRCFGGSAGDAGGAAPARPGVRGAQTLARLCYPAWPHSGTRFLRGCHRGYVLSEGHSHDAAAWRSTWRGRSTGGKRGRSVYDSFRQGSNERDTSSPTAKFSPVILSAAKGPRREGDAYRYRPFAARRRDTVYGFLTSLMQRIT